MILAPVFLGRDSRAFPEIHSKLSTEVIVVVSLGVETELKTYMPSEDSVLNVQGDESDFSLFISSLAALAQE